MTIMTRSAARFWWKEDLPKNIIYLYRDGIHEEWKEYTRSERNAEKKEKQRVNIERKNYCYKRVPCYIHVFKLNSDFIFGGYYIVIMTVHDTYYLNWKTYDSHKGFFPRIKKYLALGLLPIVDDTVWLEEFCKVYPMKTKGIQRPRGKYLTYCIIDSYNNLIDICLDEDTEAND